MRMSYGWANPNLDAQIEAQVEQQQAMWAQIQNAQSAANRQAMVKDTLRAERDKMLSEFDWDRYADQKYLAAFFRRWPDISKYLSVGE